MGLSYKSEYVLGAQLDEVRDNVWKIPHGFMNAYEVDKAYGGSEEGGWWYDYGLPLASIPFFDAKEAWDAFDVLEKILKPKYDNNISRSSMASEGDLVITIETNMAETFPQERPRYE